MVAQLKLNSFQNSGFFNNRKFNQLISAGTDGAAEPGPSAHTLTHIYILCKTNRNFRNSANSQPNRTIQLNPHCDNILLSKAILSCVSVFKWKLKFCWHWRLISGNCKFLFWNYFNFLARSLTKHNCCHKCLIVCFSNIFP